MNVKDQNMSLTGQAPSIPLAGRAGLLLTGVGILMLPLSFTGDLKPYMATLLTAFFLFTFLGAGLYIYGHYKHTHPGIRNDGVYFRMLTNRGSWGWLLGIVLTGFYILLYWYPQYLGYSDSGNSGIVALFDPLSFALKGKPASQWFVYGVLYTTAILLLGVKFLVKYRHSRYHLIRTASVMFFQLAFAFLIPEVLQGLNKPYYDFKNMWPLNYYFFYDWQLNAFLGSGRLGMFMLVWGVLMILLISPLLTYFYGKRWYCSWVCGCGGLAETAGDPFRHLSDKSLEAWQIERILVHGVLVLVTIMTAGVLINYFTGMTFSFTVHIAWIAGILLALSLILLVLQKRSSPFLSQKKTIAVSASIFLLVLGYFCFSAWSKGTAFIHFNTYELRSWYGFFIGATFSGVIGVGFYPVLGSRVWCRFGCPMAAILGLQQRFFSRFRITTNGGQCISCGNCSTYCEMGIDVRHYAQRGQNIVRASCVGCGICAAVCPRGVLRLENGPEAKGERTEILPIRVSDEGVNILM